MDLLWMLGGIALGQVLAVVSGKGGAGKTSLCAGVAASLAADGQRVLCIDADVGLRNLDISLGMTDVPTVPFTAVMRGEYPLSAAARHPIHSNLFFLTAPVTEQPEDLDLRQFGSMLEQVREDFDWCLIDAPAGVGAGFVLAVTYADQAMVVTGGDPASMRDGAKTAQSLRSISCAEAKIVVNRIRRKLFKRMRATVDDCMDAVGLPLLGIVPEDEEVTLSAVRGNSLIYGSWKGAALACRHIAGRLQGKKQPLIRL